MFSKRSWPASVGLIALACALAGCSSAGPDTAQAGSSSSNGVLGRLLSSSREVTLAEGTPLRVTIDQTIASNQARSGDTFAASFAEPVIMDGKTVIPKGAKATGTVIESRESGRLQTPALLRIALRSVEVNGKTYDLDTTSASRAGKSHKTRNIEMIGGGAGLGALIGGIAGGGKGALIGAGAGAGAGTATAAITGKHDVAFPAETSVTFKLTQPLRVEVR